MSKKARRIKSYLSMAFSESKFFPKRTQVGSASEFLPENGFSKASLNGHASAKINGSTVQPLATDPFPSTVQPSSMNSTPAIVPPLSTKPISTTVQPSLTKPIPASAQKSTLPTKTTEKPAAKDVNHSKDHASLEKYLKIKLNGYVGFAALPYQVVRRSQQRG